MSRIPSARFSFDQHPYLCLDRVEIETKSQGSASGQAVRPYSQTGLSQTHANEDPQWADVDMERKQL